MKDFILICTVVSVFILGYFIMRKVDMFLAENNLQTKEHYSASSIRIAFETLDLVEQSAELLERFSKKEPNCEIMLFYGPAERIEKGLKSREFDFGLSQILTAVFWRATFILCLLRQSKARFFPIRWDFRLSRLTSQKKT